MGGEAYISFKPGLVDSNGTIADETTRGFLKAFIDQFAATVARCPLPGRLPPKARDPSRRRCCQHNQHAARGQTIMSIRPVKRIIESKPTIEGAGVKLRRAFGCGDTGEFDPFLLLDDFRNDRPEDYRAGFPWHPHRGIETITYVLAGSVDHGDSLGNRGKLGAGDVQWMTAGSGILHQEMPQGDAKGRMHGFQLWANLPSSLK